MTMPFTPQSTAFFTSSTMQRVKQKISGPRFRLTISLIAASSGGETAGMPASIRCTPTSANFSAIRTLSSLVKITPACCSPSRSVTSWTITFFGGVKSLVTSLK